MTEAELRATLKVIINAWDPLKFGKLPPLGDAHSIGIGVRANGENKVYEADWLKAVQAAILQAQAHLVAEQVQLEPPPPPPRPFLKTLSWADEVKS